MRLWSQEFRAWLDAHGNGATNERVVALDLRAQRAGELQRLLDRLDGEQFKDGEQLDVDLVEVAKLARALHEVDSVPRRA